MSPRSALRNISNVFHMLFICLSPLAGCLAEFFVLWYILVLGLVVGFSFHLVLVFDDFVVLFYLF